jgi:phosphoglycolate phosphatase
MPEKSLDRAAIFDLDGTLLNTLADLTASMNTVLDQMGWPTHPMDAYRWFVGNGVAKLVERALPEAQRLESTIAECVRAMRAEYAGRWARTTRPYPGVEELLQALVDRDMPMAVLSNKPHEATLEMVRHFFPRTPFRIIAGAKPDTPRKPDPFAALEIAGQLGIQPGAMLFVGDSNTDMQTAAAAGMTGLGAAWGFRGREELLAAGAVHVLETPLEMLDRVK